MQVDLTAGVVAMLGDGPTADLDEFLAAYADDDNLWWMIGCGHHQNLLDAAVERIETLERTLSEYRRWTAANGPGLAEGVDDLAGEAPHRPE